MAKKNMLMLVHVENYFRDCFPNELYVARLIKAVRAKKYDKVVHITSNYHDYEPICELQGKFHKEIEWSWGYTPDYFKDEPEELKWVIHSNGGYGYTWIPLEFRNGFFDNTIVYLGGGCDGKCLEDMETILKHLHVTYKRMEGYIYSDVD